MITKKRLRCIGVTLLMLAAFAGCGAGNEYSRRSKYVHEDNPSFAVDVKDNSADSEKLTLVVSNKSDEEMSYGMAYIIEKEHKGKWYGSGEEINSNMIEVKLPKKCEWKDEIKFNKPLEAGHYRIIKTVTIADKQYTDEAEFDVVT